MNVEAVQKVRDHIASIPDRQFDMSKPELLRGCGCIMAHANKVLGESFEESFGKGDGARKLYGDLIMPEGWNEGRRYRRADAVRVLDHLLETGEVDWSIIAEQVAS